MSIVASTSRKPTCAAQELTAQQRIDLALSSLDPRCCISVLADDKDVSRKFVYQQQAKAKAALHSAFAPSAPDDPDILFHLPLTKSWLRQFVLAAVLVGHSSLRGVQEMLDCLFGVSVSFGWVHSVVQDAIDKASTINLAQDLSCVQSVALDEIFQNGKPVLTVVDVHSTYCCLLSLEDHRDADTWGLRLLELQDKGLAPEFAIGDFGKGLRAGQRAAWPEMGEADADVWHPMRDLGVVARFLENRAYAAIEAYDKLSRKAKASAEQIQAALREQDKAIALADRVTKLLGLLCNEVLCVAGPPLLDRRQRFDAVVAELRRLTTQWPSCEYKLGPVCSTLSAGRDRLLGFCARLDREVADLALYAKVSEGVLREVMAVQQMGDGDGRKWQREGELHRRLAGRYHEVRLLVEALLEGVVRASSVVENYNSRLRNYFFLRREIGGGYLDLLRFYLNHKRFVRSEHAERVGKSPAELLSGKEHEHWLQMLGYQRFSSQDLAA